MGVAAGINRCKVTQQQGYALANDNRAYCVDFHYKAISIPPLSVHDQSRGGGRQVL